MLAVSGRIATALLDHVQVKMLGESVEENERLKDRLRSRGVDVDRIAFFSHSNAPYFVRDYFLFAQGVNGDLGVVDFEWSTYGLADWCRSHLAPTDAKRAAECAAFHDPADGAVDRAIANLTGAEVISSPLVMEATGSFEVNGRGVLLISERLALQRNPAMTRDGIESALLRLPGISKIIWLAGGMAEDVHMSGTIIGDYVGWGTGGHTDEFVRFADPNTILLAWVDDEASEHPLDLLNRERMARNFDILSAASDQDGRPFRIIKTPLPRMVKREVILQEKPQSVLDWPADVFPASEGRRVGDRVVHVGASSYLNYVIANDLVLLPSYVEYGTPRAVEDGVHALMASAFPGRTIRFIDATRLNWVGGGIHCATNNEPAI